MLENIQSIIFDLDGTLVDSMWLWHDIDVEFLEQRGLTLPETYQYDIEGMSFTETAVYTKVLFHLKESVEELKSIWNQMAFDKYSHEVYFKPGAEKFLQYCRRRGIALGIATSNSKELVEAVTTALHFDDIIEVVVTACEVAHGKPAPDVYLEAAKKLSVKPEHCLVFEDVPMGIRAGKNAGMRVCAVEDSFSAHQEKEKRRLADYYISSYEQVLDNTYEIRSGYEGNVFANLPGRYGSAGNCTV